MAFRKPGRRGAQSRVGRAQSSVIGLGAAVLAGLLACGTDAVGVDSCRQIEEARCRAAPACGLQIDPPFHTNGSNVQACIRFYDTSCLHGLDVADPGPNAVNACVKTIAAGNCTAVAAPQNVAACAWLLPAGATTDADVTSRATVVASDGAAD